MAGTSRSISISTDKFRGEVRRAVEKIHIYSLQGVPFGLMDSIVKRTCPSLNTTARHAVIFSLEKVSDCTREIYREAKQVINLPEAARPDTTESSASTSSTESSSDDETGEERASKSEKGGARTSRTEEAEQVVNKDSPTFEELTAADPPVPEVEDPEREVRPIVPPVSSPRRSDVVKRKVSDSEQQVSTKKQRTSREREIANQIVSGNGRSAISTQR